MHDYDALIARLMVFFKDINLKIEPVGEELRVVQTLGCISMPAACAAIEELGWDTWLEQLLRKMSLPIAEAVEPDLIDGTASHSTNGELAGHSYDGNKPGLEAEE